MGPLVPDIIGNELNFVVAILIGFGFGYILEQAGFSSSKKLVGLFYGYDFTVLRVFFTAGVTAMIGVITLGHFGLLDLSVIYINPTFLYSALVGGLIMGLGFIIGGFCPGTSICAAAIGKIDAMYFVLGSFIGVFIFTEGYPLWEDLYKAEAWGNIRFFDLIGVSQALFAFLLTVIAVVAFWATTLIETKVNGKPNPEFNSKNLYMALSAVAIVLALAAFAMPDRKEAVLEQINDAGFVQNYKVDFIDSDELAFRLMDKDRRVQIFDFRDQAEFDSLRLPASYSLKTDNLFEKTSDKLLHRKNKINVFIADSEKESKEIAIVASLLGGKNIRVLKGGMDSFIKEILEFQTPGEAPDRKSKDTFRFREQAAIQMPLLIKEAKENAKPRVIEKPKRVLGGC